MKHEINHKREIDSLAKISTGLLIACIRKIKQTGFYPVRRLCFLIVLTGFLISASPSLTNAQNETPAAAKRGIANGASYSVSDIENINMTNGNLVLDIPLISLPKGRGEVGQSLGLVYNSKLHETGTDEMQDITGQSSLQRRLMPDYTSGWNYSPLQTYSLMVTSKLNSQAMSPCVSSYEWNKNTYTVKVEMIFPDGSRKMFRPNGYSDFYADDWYNITPNGYQQTSSFGSLGPLPNGQPSYSCGLSGSVVTTAPMVYYSTDGSYLKLVVEHSSNPQDNGGQFNPWTLYFPDGGKITGGGNNPTRTYDRNGNYVEGQTDNVGRSFTKTQGASVNEDLIKVKGFNNEELQYTVRWKNIYVQREYMTEAITGNNTRGNNSLQVHQAEYKVVDEIILPPQMGSLMYKFTYHASDTELGFGEFSSGWGEIKSVTMPSGAKIDYEYVYQTNPIYANQPRLKDVLRFYVKKKTLSYSAEYDGITTPVSEVWNYTVNNTSSTMTSPDGSVTSQKHGNVSYDNRDNGLVFESENSNGTKTEKVWEFNETPWTQGANKQINPYVKMELTSFKDGSGNYTKTVAKEYTYDKNGNVTEVKDYDFLPYNYIARNTSGRAVGLYGGVPARTTQTTYFNATPVASDANHTGNAYWNLGAPNIRNAAGIVEVKDGGGNIVSRSEMTYDDPATTGNLTQVKTWDSSKGAYSSPLNASNSISIVSQYDQYGNIVQTTDGRGIVSTLTYGNIPTPGGNIAGLYPTQTVTAAGTPQQRTAQMEYDFFTGLVKKSIDVDNNIASETVYDAPGRPLVQKAAVNTPNEVWTQTEYHDAQRRIIARGDLYTKGDGKKVAVQHFDQLGRVRLSRTLEDSVAQNPLNEADGIKVKTLYRYDNPADPANSNGSFVLKSNPYRTGNEAEMGWTISHTDKTGQISITKTFAGNTLPAPFGGNNFLTGTITTESLANIAVSMDQAGKKRRSITNGLGQLIRVDEPNETNDLGNEDTPFQPTSYTYDTLGNLVQVNQGGQTRSFQYDSLSRLRQATNPESGTISYNHDAGGNLVQKTDARGVQTNYLYDALNRVTQRSYANLPSTVAATPTVTYTYDDPTIAFSKGKLTKVSSAISETRYTQFDNLGRILSSQQQTDGQTYNFGYQYNLAGMLLQETYPSGRTVTNQFETDGDLAQVSGAFGSSSKTYVNNFNYNSARAVSALQLGNGRWETAQFNSRLQPIQIGLGTAINDQSLLKLNFDYGANNNGNVMSQQITIGGQLLATQNYNYDTLNRLKSAEENNGQSWKQVFVYDRFGNRRFDQTQTTTLGNCPQAVCNPTVDQANNRLVGYQYDQSGNTQQDAEQRLFIYDAENKQVQVRNAQATDIGTYLYDGDGKRVKKIAAQETTLFAYDASGRLAAEYTVSTSQSQSPQTSYLTNDPLGSPRITTNQAGNVQSRRDFMPFGEEITGLGNRTAAMGYQTDTIRQKFTSYERDNETALDYAKNRFHNFSLGRFTSPDPYKIVAEIEYEQTEEKAIAKLNNYLNKPQQWNGYSYAINNPLKYTDPTGEYIELTGSEEEINEKLKRINDFLGDRRFQLLTQLGSARSGKVILTLGGSLDMCGSKCAWFASVGINAEDKEFGRKMAELLQSSQAVEFNIGTETRIKSKVLNEFGNRTETTVSVYGKGGAFTVPSDESMSGKIQIWVAPNAAKIGNIEAARQDTSRLTNDDSQLRFPDNSVVDAHEFGHAYDLITGAQPNTNSLIFENARRANLPGTQRRKSEK
jgi:RHS repeat-associated protein